MALTRGPFARMRGVMAQSARPKRTRLTLVRVRVRVRARVRVRVRVRVRPKRTRLTFPALSRDL